MDNYKDIVTSIDKDSIRRGTDSKKFPKFNREDGYSAIIKIDIKLNDTENIEMKHLVSFYEKDGEKKFCMLESFIEGDSPLTEDEVIQENVYNGGRVWPKVLAYIEKNIK